MVENHCVSLQPCEMPSTLKIYSKDELTPNVIQFNCKSFRSRSKDELRL